MLAEAGLIHVYVEARRSTMPAPGSGIVRGKVTENLYRSGR